MSIRTGIDLGTAGVKLVRGDGGARLDRVTHCEFEEWEPGESGNGAEAVARAAGALGRILNRLGAARRRLGRVAVGVGGEESGLREVLLPRLPGDEIGRALPFEARKHLTLEDMVSPTLAFQILGAASSEESSEANQDRVLIAAVSSPQRDFALRVLSAHGIEPEVIDLEPLAGLNALLAAVPETELGDQVVGLLDIGGRQTNLCITQAAGRLLTRTVGPGITVTSSSAKTGEHIESLTRRTLETFAFYRGRYRRDVGRLFLAGGGALHEGLCAALQAGLGVPVKVLDPFAGVDLPRGAKEPAARAPQYATACGLCRWWDAENV